MKTIFRTTLGLATAGLLATTAQAYEQQATETDTAVITETQTVRTIDADGRIGEIVVFTADRSEQDALVLGAFSQQATDAYIVRDNEGDLFINHVIDIEDLPDPSLQVEAVETYEIIHRGITFTNKIVDER